MKTRLALFDLDGTLFDTREVNFSAYEEALVEYGFRLDYLHYLEHCQGRHYLHFLPDLVGGDLELTRTVHDRKKALYGQYVGLARPNNHLLDLIRLMRAEYFTCVATSASMANALEVLNYFDVLDLFDLTISGDDVVHAKPDPECLLKALDYFGIGRQQAIIFEDSDVGELAAQKAGIACVLVRGFG